MRPEGRLHSLISQNDLREYLSTKEREATTIMMDLFDQKRATEEYAEEMAEEVADYVPSLSLDELREIEANTMQMA